MTTSKQPRRDFLKTTGTVAAASALVSGSARFAHAAEASTIQLALVGCGGRGTGAAHNALSVKDGSTKLVAMADMFDHRLKASAGGLKKYGERGTPPEDFKFIGFDGYKQAMDCLTPGDVVILTTPPAFRWLHFTYAIEKGLNVFMEKPITVDGPGTRKMLELAKKAVDGGDGEVLPLATQVHLLHENEKVDEAKAAFESLRPLAVEATLDSPPLAALAPIAAEFGYPEDWRIDPGPADDLGERPDLDSLGPFRWAPPAAPGFALPDANGTLVGLEDFAGRSVLVIFYLGRGCTHCMEQLNAFAPLEKAYAGAGIDIVAIGTDSIDLEAARDGIQRVPADQIPRKRTVLRRGWIFILPFAVLVVGLFSFNLEPETAAIYASAVLIALGFSVGYQGRRMRLRDIWDSLVETGILALDLIMIGAAVGLIIGILAKSGLGFALTLMLVNVGGGSFLLLLVLAALVCIVLGMGMPTFGVYVLVAALVAPAMVEVGVNAMAAHMFVLYFGMMSFITPPICIAAFAAARLADSDQMRTGFAAARFGWSAFVVPFLFVFSPSLVLQGQPLELVHDVATALAGVWLVSAGLIGFLFRRLSAAERALLILGGGLLLFPSTAIPGGLWTDLAGLAIAAPTLVLVYRNARLRRAAAAE